MVGVYLQAFSKQFARCSI